jgi:hypothetical protein
MIDKLAEASISDTTTIVYGSEFNDGRSHTMDPQPLLIAGGGGNLKMGQVIDASPMGHTGNDVYAFMLTALGQRVEKFGIENCKVGHIKQLFKV